MAYSNNGAYLAAIDDKKIARVFNVADGYSVNFCLPYSSVWLFIQYPVPVEVSYTTEPTHILCNHGCFVFFFSGQK